MDNPANVYLMTDADYTHYLEGGDFTYHGGYVKTGLKKLKAPAAGHWHLVIDNKNQLEGVNVTLQVVNGKTIEQQWEEPSAAEQEKSRKQIQAAEKQPETGNELTAKELAAKKKDLVKELTQMIKQIDMEGLLFLMKQASVIIHNQQVEQLNQKIEDYNQTLTHQKKGTKQKKDIETDKPSLLVDLKENSENSFILVLNGVRKALSRYELGEIVRICHMDIDDNHFAVRVYKWLKEKRTDILFDSGIKSSNHPLLITMREFLMNRYKPRKG